MTAIFCLIAAQSGAVDSGGAVTFQRRPKDPRASRCASGGV